MPLLAAIVTLVLATGDDKLKAEGFVPLFDGKSLDGWKVYGAKQNVWAAEDGMIVCKGAGGGWIIVRRNLGTVDPIRGEA